MSLGGSIAINQWAEWAMGHPGGTWEGKPYAGRRIALMGMHGGGLSHSNRGAV